MKFLFLAVLVAASVSQADSTTGYRKIFPSDKTNYVNAIEAVTTREMLGDKCSTMIEFINRPLTNLYIQDNLSQPLIIAERATSNETWQFRITTDAAYKTITQIQYVRAKTSTVRTNVGNLANPQFVNQEVVTVLENFDCATGK